MAACHDSATVEPLMASFMDSLPDDCLVAVLRNLNGGDAVNQLCRCGVSCIDFGV